MPSGTPSEKQRFTIPILKVLSSSVVISATYEKTPINIKNHPPVKSKSRLLQNKIFEMFQ